VAQTLEQILLEPTRRPAVVADLADLVDGEVAGTGGVSGAVVKTGYAAARRLRPTLVPTMVDKLLGEFAAALQPYWAAHRAAPSGDFGDHLAAWPEAADALLTVTDARARRSSSEVLRGAYEKLRPQAQRHVTDALAQLGRLVDKHAAAG